MDPHDAPDKHDTLVLVTPPNTASGTQVQPGRATGRPVPYPLTPHGWQRTPAWQPAPINNAATPILVMRNNAAVVGATLGSVALFMSLLPLIGILAWVIAPIGLISSAVGILVGMSRRVGRFGAWWGLLTSGLALLVCTAWVALLMAL